MLFGGGWLGSAATRSKVVVVVGISFPKQNVLYGMRGGRTSYVMPSRHELLTWDNLFDCREEREPWSERSQVQMLRK